MIQICLKPGVWQYVGPKQMYWVIMRTLPETLTSLIATKNIWLNKKLIKCGLVGTCLVTSSPGRPSRRITKSSRPACATQRSNEKEGRLEVGGGRDITQRLKWFLKRRHQTNSELSHRDTELLQPQAYISYYNFSTAVWTKITERGRAEGHTQEMVSRYHASWRAQATDTWSTCCSDTNTTTPTTTALNQSGAKIQTGSRIPWWRSWTRYKGGSDVNRHVCKRIANKYLKPHSSKVSLPGILKRKYIKKGFNRTEQPQTDSKGMN